MANYASHVSTRKTPQTEPIFGKESKMTKNSAGGYSFVLGDWQRLERFLILGAEGGTYYATERALTKENAGVVLKCAKEDGKRTVDTIVDVSVSGRAPKNDPAIFALALVAKCAGDAEKDVWVRQYAFSKMSEVCRIGTHLFMFAEAVKALGGWGRATVRAFSDWYLKKQSKDLVHQVLKYQNRLGWSHRDILRKAHPGPLNESSMLSQVFSYVVGDPTEKVALGLSYDDCRMPAPLDRIWAFERAKKLTSESDVGVLVKLIQEYDLPRECLPTESLKHRKVWEAMLPRMPLTALVRNLGKMSSLGMLGPLSAGEKFVVGKLSDAEIFRKARMHPIALLVALKTYGQGHGVKGNLTWDVNQRVVDALDDGFYAAFGQVKPTGKNFLFGIDVSGSMASPFANFPISACQAAGVMAMVTARVEKHYAFMGFCHDFVELRVSPKMRLDEVCREIQRNNFGRTDCALPMTWATKNKMEVDVFEVLTDGESYFGDVHPTQALATYRQRSGRPAKEVVAAMTSTGFSIADPDDAGQLDVVGFDLATPNVIADFAAGGFASSIPVGFHLEENEEPSE